MGLGRRLVIVVVGGATALLVAAACDSGEGLAPAELVPGSYSPFRDAGSRG